MKFAAFPFIRYLLCFLASIIFYDRFAFFSPLLYLFLAGMLCFYLLLIFLKKYNFCGICMGIIFFLLAWIISYQKTPINDSFHFFHHQAFNHYEAQIIGNAEVKPKSYKVEAEIRSIEKAGKWQKSMGRVLLYFNKAESPRPQYGDLFLLKGSPRLIEAPKNPQEFDYRLFMQRKGIYAHHFLRKNDFIKIGNQPPNALMNVAIHANTYADSLFRANIQHKNEYAIANAMIVGLRDEIDNELLQAYSASGAIHVISVSGMHVAILFVMIRSLLGGIKKLKFGNVIFILSVIILLWLYAIFTGLSSTVLRATLMFSFVQAAELVKRRSNIYNTLAVSALCLLCYNPFWAFDVGFQLSYLAIIGIVYLHPILNQLFSPTTLVVRKMVEISSVAFSAQLATFPLSMYYFHQFPTFFLLANPFVFFFSEGILPLGLLLLFLGWFPFFAKIISFWLKLSLFCLNGSIFLIEKLPFSTMRGFSLSIPETLLIYLFIIFLIAFFWEKELKYLRTSFFILLTLVAWNIWKDFRQNQQKTLTFHFIPKNIGLSILEGKTATFFADSVLLANPKIYDFHLKNYYDYHGIEKKKFVAIEQYTNQNGMNCLDFAGKRILWLRKPFRGHLTGKIDFLLLSNNALRSLNGSVKDFSIKQIIVDDTNKRYVVERLKGEADSLKINLVSLYDTGALTIQE